MKKTFILFMIVAALGMMSCEPKPVEVNSSDDNTVASFKGSDMAVFENGKMTFYNSSTNQFVPFTAEKDYVVSGVYYDENEFYYTVSVDDELYLKKVDLSADKPAPVELIDWELKLSDCYDESCEKCASMVFYSDVQMVGIEYNMGEMCKGFQDMKYYLIDEQTMSDGWPEGVDDGFLMYQDFINMPIEEGEEEMRYYYCPEDYGMYSEEELPEHLVCISDKINFHEGKYEGWEGQPEFTFLTINPDDGCVAYAAIMEWGRGGRGPLCFATVDGKIQKILAYDANCGWLEDGRLVFNDEEGLKTVSPDGTINKLTSGKFFVTSYK